MKRYIHTSYDIEPTITSIILEDASGTFSMEAYDNQGDTIWVGINEDDPSEYCLCTALDGFVISDPSLYEVLVQFTDIYDVSRDFVRQIFEFARKYKTK
jgi:hypothetical protein